MKKLLLIVAVFSSLLLTAGCGATETKGDQAFTEEAAVNLRKNAIAYSKEDLEADNVPLNSFIKVTGKITATDSEDGKVGKGTRFKLNSDGYDIQIFNEQTESYQVGDEVTVYGEYYGFIKGAVIDAAQHE